MLHDRKPLLLFVAMFITLIGGVLLLSWLVGQGRVRPLGELLRQPIGCLLGVKMTSNDGASASASNATNARSERLPVDEDSGRNGAAFRVSGGLVPAPQPLGEGVRNIPKPERPSAAHLTKMDGDNVRTGDALVLSEEDKAAYVDKRQEPAHMSKTWDTTAKAISPDIRQEKLKGLDDANRAKNLIPNGDAYVQEGFEAPELIMGVDISDIDRLVRTGDGIVVGKLGGRDYRVNLEGPDGSILQARRFFVVRDTLTRGLSNRRLELNTSASSKAAFASLESRFVASVGEEKHEDPVFVFYPSARVDAYIVRKQWGALYDAGFDKERVRELLKTGTRIATRGRLVVTSGHPVFAIREIIVGDQTISWADPERE